jgi:hypothetical protein
MTDEPRAGCASEAVPVDLAPRDGTMLRLLVQFEGTSFEDSLEPCWTIGFNNFGNTEEDRWQFAGWNWCHDCITEGVGKVLGWLPMHDTPPQPPTTDEPRAGCASEAEVVEAMGMASVCTIKRFWDEAASQYRDAEIRRMTRALTAARALGCLLPDEAAALREDKETFRDLINGCGIAHKALLKERDALAARLKVAEEALREGRRAIGDHFAPNDCYATGPATSDPYRDLVECPACSFIAMYDRAKARAALTPAAGDAP